MENLSVFYCSKVICRIFHAAVLFPIQLHGFFLLLSPFYPTTCSTTNLLCDIQLIHFFLRTPEFMKQEKPEFL